MGTRTIPFSYRDYFFVSNLCCTVISEPFSYHQDRIFRLSWDFLIKEKGFFRVAECNQDFVAPAPCRIPCELRDWSLLSWHPHYPIYPLRSFVCHSERAPAWTENAFWCCVLDRTRKEIEWRNLREAVVEPSGTMQLSMRDRDEQTKQERVWSDIQNWGANPVSSLKKIDLSLEFWAEEIATLLGNSSIWNQQSTRIVNGWTEIRGKQTEFIVARRQMTEMIEQQGSYTTSNQGLLRLSSLLRTIEGFWLI